VDQPTRLIIRGRVTPDPQDRQVEPLVPGNRSSLPRRGGQVNTPPPGCSGPHTRIPGGASRTAALAATKETPQNTPPPGPVPPRRGSPFRHISSPARHPSFPQGPRRGYNRKSVGRATLPPFASSPSKTRRPPRAVERRDPLAPSLLLPWPRPAGWPLPGSCLTDRVEATMGDGRPAHHPPRRLLELLVPGRPCGWPPREGLCPSGRWGCRGWTLRPPGTTLRATTLGAPAARRGIPGWRTRRGDPPGGAVGRAASTVLLQRSGGPFPPGGEELHPLRTDRWPSSPTPPPCWGVATLPPGELATSDSPAGALPRGRPRGLGPPA
jgi:hypothetical protein